MSIHQAGAQPREQKPVSAMVAPPVSQPVTEEVSGKVCAVLSDILRGGVDVHRCIAAQALGRIGYPAAVEPLIEALLDEDEDVRTDAAAALAVLAPPQAGRQLFENLIGDPCTDVKLAAIDALARMKDPQVVPWLRRMVRARDEEIVWDEDEFYASGWDDWVDVQIKSVEALAELGADEAVSDIVDAMNEEDGQDMTEIAFKALARLGKPGIEALADFLGDGDPRRRRRAAAALAAIDADEAAEPTGRALADSLPEVRLAAARGLAARAPSDARLEALFEDRDAAVRAGIARACGRLHPDRLRALLGDQSGGVQIAALEVMAEAEDARADDILVETLRAKLSAPSSDLVAAGALAFAACAPRAAVDDLTALLGETDKPVEARLGALRGLARIGGETVAQALVDTIGDRERLIRLEAMSALAAIAGSDAGWPNIAGEALLAALRNRNETDTAGDDGEDPPSAGAAPEFADAPAPEGLPGTEGAEDNFPTSTLHAILNDVPKAGEMIRLPDEGIELTPADMERLAIARRIKGKSCMPVMPDVVLAEDVRRFAARVLGDLDHEDVVRELAAALADDDREVRLAAADSLARVSARAGRLPGPVGEALLAALTDSDRDFKMLLIRALAAVDSEHAFAALKASLGDEDSFIRAEAVRGLSRAGEDCPEIEALLADPDPSVRLIAAEVVAAAGGGKALGLLVNFAFSFEGYHRRQAASLLRALDAPIASARFVDALRDESCKRAWPVAIEALEELNRPQPTGTA